MNQNGMNNMGMNPMEINQMGMNNIGMNFMGMNPMGPVQMGMKYQPNLMNEMFMDETSKNIKNIVLPYENKIRELEEIIRQKDFEITVLKQKLNNNISNFNLMNMNNLNRQNDKGNEISFRINLENENSPKFVKCFEGDKASIIRENLNINKGILTYNYMYINENLSIKENELFDGAIIKVSNQLYSMKFSYSSKKQIKILCLDEDCPVGIAILIYCFERKAIYKLLNDKLVFLYNGLKLSIQDKTSLKEKFPFTLAPVIAVENTHYLIG